MRKEQFRLESVLFGGSAFLLFCLNSGRLRVLRVVDDREVQASLLFVVGTLCRLLSCQDVLNNATLQVCVVANKSLSRRAHSPCIINTCFQTHTHHSCSSLHGFPSAEEGQPIYQPWSTGKFLLFHLFEFFIISSLFPASCIYR